jgi:hypothetical protein
LIEQNELGLRLHGLVDTSAKGEGDGYVLGAFGADAIRVVQDVPGASSNVERARFDELAVGDLLGARVALDVEQVIPCDRDRNDGRGGVGMVGIRSSAYWIWHGGGMRAVRGGQWRRTDGRGNFFIYIYFALIFEK